MFQGLLVDNLFADVRRVARLNGLVATCDAGALERWRAGLDRPALREVPFAIIAPVGAGRTRAPGRRRAARASRRPAHAACPNVRLLDRLLGADTPLQGELLSYLLFDHHFIDGAIGLGRRDARRWLADNPGLWRLAP